MIPSVSSIFNRADEEIRLVGGIFGAERRRLAAECGRVCTRQPAWIFCALSMSSCARGFEGNKNAAQPPAPGVLTARRAGLLQRGVPELGISMALSSGP